MGSIAFATLLLGCAAAWFYHDAGLTLSHYDTKGHLVVARRVIDSLTPGWKQLGAVWLPLPHLLNLLPVQIDVFYRTGASAVAISVLAFSLAVSTAARIVLRSTGSVAAALGAGCVLALNPDLLYLQSTPMTEALLVALMLVATWFTYRWLEEQAAASTGVHPAPEMDATRTRRLAGWTLVAACLTRYEAWPFTAALLGLGAVSLFLRGAGMRDAIARVARLAIYPTVAVCAFLVQSRLTVGRWFVTDGFFVPDNLDTGNPFRAVASVWWGAHVVAGYGVLLAAVAGAAAVLVVALRDRRRASLLTLFALFAVGALPAYAFYDGHPFRIRYMTPLVAGLAVSAGMAVAMLGRWWRYAAAVALACLVVFETRPFDLRAPMLLEAQWDSGNEAARREVTRYLAAHYDGRTILASMASLAHFMQETSRVGFDLRDFLHEGNGDMWRDAIKDPRPYVGWIAIEEWAEGGDGLAALARQNPHFLDGFARVAEGGGVALYRKTEAVPTRRTSESLKGQVASR